MGGLARVLITGSRDWEDRGSIEYALSRAYERVGPFVLVNGGARGADTLGRLIHSNWGGVVETHLAQWHAYGGGAGIIRNEEMVARGADLCIAFIRDESAGATHCAAAAEQAGIPTYRWTA